MEATQNNTLEKRKQAQRMLLEKKARIQSKLQNEKQAKPKQTKKQKPKKGFLSTHIKREFARVQFQKGKKMQEHSKGQGSMGKTFEKIPVSEPPSGLEQRLASTL